MASGALGLTIGLLLLVTFGVFRLENSSSLTWYLLGLFHAAIVFVPTCLLMQAFVVHGPDAI